jgi:hypothetical protein
MSNTSANKLPPCGACIARECTCQSFVSAVSSIREIVKTTPTDVHQQCVGCDHQYYQHKTLNISAVKGGSILHGCGGYVSAAAVRFICCHTQLPADAWDYHQDFQSS